MVGVKFSSNFEFQNSQGNVATYRCKMEVFYHRYIESFRKNLSAKLLKIGQHLLKLWSKVQYIVFLRQSVLYLLSSISVIIE